MCRQRPWWSGRGAGRGGVLTDLHQQRGAGSTRWQAGRRRRGGTCWRGQQTQHRRAGTLCEVSLMMQNCVSTAVEQCRCEGRDAQRERVRVMHPPPLHTRLHPERAVHGGGEGGGGGGEGTHPPSPHLTQTGRRTASVAFLRGAPCSRRVERGCSPTPRRC